MRSIIGVVLLALSVESLVLPEQLQKREQRTEVIYTNVAEGKETTQSSTGHGGVSSRAVDGETSGHWGHGSCTHGNNAGLQYWEVDLGSNYNISYIEVYGRTDCCSSRITGAKLWVGNNLCKTLSDKGAAQMEHVECDNPAESVGRKIRIEVLNTLTLCEVKVMVKSSLEYEVDVPTDTPAVHKGEEHGEQTNVAIHKTTEQSNTCSHGYSSNAVDGYTAGHYWNQRSCTCAYSSKTMNYWQVDLGRVYNISEIKIWGRTDANPASLNGATVKIGTTTCATLEGITQAKPDTTVKCEQEKMSGRYVRVEKWNTYVILCEVQVMVDNKALPAADEVIATVDYSHIGEEIEGYFNVAKGKNTSQSSDGWGGTAEKAVDGGTAQNWHDGSCTHTKDYENPYWMVDLGRVYQIDHIRIWGRTDGHTYRLQDAKLWIDDHRCGSLVSMGTAAEADVITCSEKESAGRYVKIEQLKQYLTLCEVQVMVKKSQADYVPLTHVSRGQIIGEYTDIAFKKDAVQSTNGWGGDAYKAVDGWVKKRNWNEGSCTHTTSTADSWWEVDLGRSTAVDHIMVYGRNDAHQNRLQWARVWLGNNLCEYLTEENVDETDTGDVSIFKVSCPEGSYGQKVRIERLNNYLTLCEVQVMVKSETLEDDSDEMPTTTPTIYNVARRKNTVQSSTGWGGVSSRAVDGFYSDNSRMWNYGSCTHTHRQTYNYWEVDLEQEEYISYIEIMGRADCCGDRLEGAIITLDNRTVSGLSYTKDQTFWSIDTNKLKGRFLRVSLENEYLTLCEVRAMVDYDYDATTDTNLVDPAAENLVRLENVVITSSSEAVGGEAAKAVDGEIDGNYYRGGCFSSAVQQGSRWWMSTFVGEQTVGKVIVYPRLDSISDYLGGAEVRVGDQLCGTIEYDNNKLWYTVECEGKKGESVTISRDTGYLQFCEVIVQAAE